MAIMSDSLNDPQPKPKGFVVAVKHKPQVEEEEDGIGHITMGTAIISISYNFKDKELEIYQESWSCCDGRAAINLALSIDTRCTQIQTFQGDKHDTTYVLIDGKWFVQTFETYVPKEG